MKETPPWIVARLGEDLNWWIESTSDNERPPPHNRGILDPRQVRHLAQTVIEYQPYGLREQDLNTAFTPFTLQSEIDEGRVRLEWSKDDSFTDGGDLFAVPVLDDEGDGPYVDFLDAMAAAHVRKLNDTHAYIHDCTTDEMSAELAILVADRYFSDESRHCFDEINEILEWSPAEWDDASES